MIVVNLFAGPGAGKSTLAAQVFSLLKWENVNCELVTEYAKDLVWSDCKHLLDNQLYILGEQYFRLKSKQGKVEAVVTDSPLPLQVYYNAGKLKNFDPLVLECYEQFKNLNFFINRVKPYNPKGRVHTEDEAHQADKGIKQLLWDIPVPFINITGNPDAAHKIFEVAYSHIRG